MLDQRLVARMPRVAKPKRAIRDDRGDILRVLQGADVNQFLRNKNGIARLEMLFHQAAADGRQQGK